MDSVTTYRKGQTGGVNPEKFRCKLESLDPEINQYSMHSVHNNINL